MSTTRQVLTTPYRDVSIGRLPRPCTCSRTRATRQCSSKNDKPYGSSFDAVRRAPNFDNNHNSHPYAHAANIKYNVPRDPQNKRQHCASIPQRAGTGLRRSLWNIWGHTKNTLHLTRPAARGIQSTANKPVIAPRGAKQSSSVATQAKSNASPQVPYAYSQKAWCA